MLRYKQCVYFKFNAKKCVRILLNGVPLNYDIYEYDWIVLIRGSRACSLEVSVSIIKPC